MRERIVAMALLFAVSCSQAPKKNRVYAWLKELESIQFVALDSEQPNSSVAVQRKEEAIARVLRRFAVAHIPLLVSILHNPEGNLLGELHWYQRPYWVLRVLSQFAGKNREAAEACHWFLTRGWERWSNAVQKKFYPPSTSTRKRRYLVHTEHGWKPVKKTDRMYPQCWEDHISILMAMALLGWSTTASQQALREFVKKELHRWQPRTGSLYYTILLALALQRNLLDLKDLTPIWQREPRLIIRALSVAGLSRINKETLCAVLRQGLHAFLKRKDRPSYFYFGLGNILITSSTGKLLTQFPKAAEFPPCTTADSWVVIPTQKHIEAFLWLLRKHTFKKQFVLSACEQVTRLISSSLRKSRNKNLWKAATLKDVPKIWAEWIPYPPPLPLKFNTHSVRKTLESLLQSYSVSSEKIVQMLHSLKEP